MKLHIFALTRLGAELARQLAGKLRSQHHESVIFLPGRFVKPESGEQAIGESLPEAVAGIFHETDGLIMIGAAGIAVRVTAPLLTHKTKDPAVLVMDERGRFVISLLSGHWGGANRLTAQIAALMNAVPVITTASDLAGITAVDDLAAERGWHLEGLKWVKELNAAMLNGDPVAVYCDDPRYVKDVVFPEHCRLHWGSLPAEATATPGLIISNRQAARRLAEYCVLLVPKTLTVGIGCRRGTAEKTILQAVTGALAACGRSANGIHCAASIDMKQDEAGLLSAAEKLGIECRFFPAAALTAVEHLFEGSVFVKEKVGAAAVAEPCAYLACREPEMILPKMKTGGVTAAVFEDWGVTE